MNKDSKKEIRKKYLEKRNRLSEKKRNAAGDKITARLLGMPEVKSAPVVFVYASYKTEVSTKKLIQSLLLEGKTVALPKVDGREMQFFEVTAWEELIAGYQGIMEPQGREQVLCPHTQDVMLLPGACFDYSGHRIGYGGGYYDRYLQRLSEEKPLKIGLAFQCQVYPEVLPAEPQDENVDYVVTERKTVKAKKNKVKGYGILADIIELVIEFFIELLDGVG